MSAGAAHGHDELFRALGLRPHHMAGRTALVTGAARGIGEHTAYALAALGAALRLVDINPEGERVARKIRDEGGEAVFAQADIGDLAALDKLLGAGAQAWRATDILINNAAHLTFGPVLDQPASIWSADFAANVLGHLTLIQALAPGMIERRRGVVISLISLEGMPFMGAYCASKMALRSLMLSLGKEVPPGSGVSVLSVVPGAVDTPLANEMIETFARRLGIPEADVRATMSKNPGYSGLVPVEHVAASLAWYCVNAAQFHGQFVDGYLPLSQAGVIDVTGANEGDAKHPSSPYVVPNPERELKHLIEINRSLENRIQERTRELEEANQKLHMASLTDPLTGLWNRRYADLAIGEEVDSAKRRRDAASPRLHLVVIDIDHFKHINDTRGHLCGDAVLKEMARLLRTQTRASDKVMRWGGEEFLIVARCVEPDQIQGLVERIRRTVAEHRFADQYGDDFSCTCSLGFTSIPLTEGAAELPWVSMADLCMYAAKKGGRNRWSGIEIHAEGVKALSAATVIGDVAKRAGGGELSVFSSDENTRRALLETVLPKVNRERHKIAPGASA